VYVLPPVRYPNGRIYVKVGADHDRDVCIDTAHEMHAYMTSEGSPQTRKKLVPVLSALLPKLARAPVVSKPCLLTYTPSGYPMVDELEKGWDLAAGGCGQAAKSSDQIGKLAVDLVCGTAWAGFKRSTFAARERNSFL